MIECQNLETKLEEENLPQAMLMKERLDTGLANYMNSRPMILTGKQCHCSHVQVSGWEVGSTLKIGVCHV